MRGPRILLPWKARSLCTFSYVRAALAPAVPPSTTWIAGIYADTNAPVVYSDSHEPHPRLGHARWTPLAGFRPAVPHPARARLAEERENSIPGFARSIVAGWRPGVLLRWDAVFLSPRLRSAARRNLQHHRGPWRRHLDWGGDGRVPLCERPR